MKNLPQKKYTLVLLLLSVSIIGAYYFSVLNLVQTFSPGFMMGVLKPLVVLAFSMLIISLGFLFLSDFLLKSWFKYIAWWYGVVTYILVASTPIYSSNILATSRPQVVLWCMIVLAIITVPFVIVMKKKLKI